MPCFWIKLEVIPTEHNNQYSVVRDATANCWIVEESDRAAYNKARMYLLKDEWKILEPDIHVKEVGDSDFADINTLHYHMYTKAKSDGIGMLFEARPLDGRTVSGPIVLKSSHENTMQRYLDKKKNLAQKGRCLHFDNGQQCNEIIKAHSIQENGQLSAISNDGHVYAISKNMGTIAKNKGKPSLEKQGIGRVSTFMGLCQFHDNKVFSPIDKLPLLPTNEQVLLYSYRSVLRELFVKQNALELLDSQLSDLPMSSTRRLFYEDVVAGTAFGLESLRVHKNEYDNSLKTEIHEDIEYVLFISQQKPFAAFSGVFYPEFDVLGRRLQNLGDQTTLPQLLTVCSATLENGWGLLLAWHKTSSAVCKKFVGAIAKLAYKNQSEATEAMFRMIVSNCENIAFSPNWWENLMADQQRTVLLYLAHGASLFSPTDPKYMAEGMTGICRWEFDKVYSSLVF